MTKLYYITALFLSILIYFPLFCQDNYIGSNPIEISNQFRKQYPDFDSLILNNRYFNIAKRISDSNLIVQSVIWNFEDDICFSEVHVVVYRTNIKKEYKAIVASLQKKFKYNKKDDVYYFYVKKNAIPIYIKLFQKDKHITITYFTPKNTLRILRDYLQNK